MKVNNFREFRNRYKYDKGYTEHSYNPHFMGTYHNGTSIKGFFNMFHGDKPDIGGFLRADLDMAEDDQAIYEFIQNAVDCKSTKFMVFYDDENFMAINNGRKFDYNGLVSILNIGQSTKRTASDIGRLGIGFKLAHRLVGKQNGIKELLDYKGPIVFSWNRISQLRNFLSEDKIVVNSTWSDNLAFLFKILITNFPAQIGEEIKDLEYQNRIVFPEKELIEMRQFVSSCIGNNYDDFKQGTITFLKLGSGKRNRLDSNSDNLLEGIQYSMNTLKQLRSVSINGEEVTKKNLIIKNNIIKKECKEFEELEVEYKDHDVNYSFGFIPIEFNNIGFKEIERLKRAPNFYKYFPMGDERDGYGLFIHCDSFNIQSNRRELNEGITNEKLLPIIANFICSTLDYYKINDYEKYKQLYASILLSDPEDGWIKNVFYESLIDYLRVNVPILGNKTTDDCSLVRIKNVKTSINLKSIGLSNYSWFYWNRDEFKILANAAHDKDKLHLYRWNINDVIENADLDKLNSWLSKINSHTYNRFMRELAELKPTQYVKKIISKLRLFEFEDGRKSWNEIFNDATHLISMNSLVNIKDILKKLGYKCTILNFEDHPLKEYLSDCHQTDKWLFENIQSTKKSKIKRLNHQLKVRLLIAFSEFENVGDNSIKKIPLFKNINGDLSPLGALISYREPINSWLNPYIISPDDFSEALHPYIVKDENIYSEIVSIHFEKILKDISLNELFEQFQEKWDSNLTKSLIEKYGPTIDILGIIENKIDGNSFDSFMNACDYIPLNEDKEYSNDSYEYRLIKIATQLNNVVLRNKIYINGTKLTDFPSSNNLKFSIKSTNQKISDYYVKFSDVITDDKLCMAYGKICKQFESISNYTIIFSEDNNNIENVSHLLLERLQQSEDLITPAQYVFILLLRAITNKKSLGNWQPFVHLKNIKQVVGIISYCYDNNLIPVLASYKNLSIWKSLVQGKYLFSKEYTLESEQADQLLEDWCGEDPDKKKTLISLDMHFNDSAEIKRRKAFLENNLSEWDTNLSDTPLSFLNWVNSIKPIEGQSQKKLLLSLATNAKVSRNHIKQIFNENDFLDAKELATEKYKMWSIQSNMCIFILEHEIPYRIVNHTSEILCIGNNGDYHFFNDTNNLYIVGISEEEIAAVLSKVYTDQTVPFSYEDYVSICFKSLEEQRAMERKIKELEQTLNKKREEEDFENDRNTNIEFSKAIKTFMGTGFEMPQNKVKQAHLITRFRCMMYLKGMYGLSTSFDEKGFVESGEYQTIRLANGQEVHIQGAIYGIWYISTSTWTNIINGTCWVCLCYGNNDSDFKVINDYEDLQKLVNSTNNVVIRVHGDKLSDNMKTLNRVFPGKVGGGQVQLLLKLHETPNKDINKMFNAVFKTESNYDGL